MSRSDKRGNLSPHVPERAHAVSLVTKVSNATKNLPAMPEAPSPRELAKPTGFDGGSSAVPLGKVASPQAMTEGVLSFQINY